MDSDLMSFKTLIYLHVNGSSINVLPHQTSRNIFCIVSPLCGYIQVKRCIVGKD